MTSQRIISLVPSQTELLHSLGLRDEVVGITKFCVHPAEWFRSKSRVGGTKQLDIEAIHALQPDLIIANKEENVKEQVEELARHYRVWVTDVNTLEDAFEMIKQVGILTGTNERALEIVDGIRQNFARLVPLKNKPGTAYLIWRNPYMAAGGDTFIHSMLSSAGFENIFSARTRYPEITIEDLKAANCELLLLSSEPFPFKEKHAEEIQKELPGAKIILVDGEMFSWYGSRLLYAPDYFKTVIRG